MKASYLCEIGLFRGFYRLDCYTKRQTKRVKLVAFVVSKSRVCTFYNEWSLPSTSKGPYSTLLLVFTKSLSASRSFLSRGSELLFFQSPSLQPPSAVPSLKSIFTLLPVLRFCASLFTAGMTSSFCFGGRIHVSPNVATGFVEISLNKKFCEKIHIHSLNRKNFPVGLCSRTLLPYSN